MNSLTLTWWKLSSRLRLLSLVLFVASAKNMKSGFLRESWDCLQTDLSSCCRASAAQHCVLFLGSALPGAVTLCSICWEQWGGLRLWAQLSWLCADTWGPRGALSVSPSVSHHVSLLYLRSAVLCGSSHTAGSLQELSGRPPAGRMVAVQAVLTAESKSTCTDFVPAL